MYFEYEELEKELEKHRGWFMQICFDKKDRTERVLTGVLCKAKGQFIINQGEVDEPDFRAFSHNKVKWVKCDGVTYRPKTITESKETSNATETETETAKV